MRVSFRFHPMAGRGFTKCLGPSPTTRSYPVLYSFCMLSDSCLSALLTRIYKAGVTNTLAMHEVLVSSSLPRIQPTIALDDISSSLDAWFYRFLKLAIISVVWRFAGCSRECLGELKNPQKGPSSTLHRCTITLEEENTFILKISLA